MPPKAVPAELAGISQELMAQILEHAQNPQHFYNSLEPEVQKRVDELKKLQEENEKFDEELKKEMHALHKKYKEKYADPLWKARAEIVSGEREVEGVTNSSVKGVPRFWATVLQNNEMLMEAFGQKDLDILEYLYDIQEEVFLEEDSKGFSLKFLFKPNPYFTNTELTKAYYFQDDDMAVLEKPVGCKIDWKEGQDVTKAVVKPGKGKGGKAKASKPHTFFTFFSPPKIPEESEQSNMTDKQIEKLQTDVEMDHEVASIIREMIPSALRWFLGEIEDDDSDFDEDHSHDDDDDEDEDDDNDDDDDDDDDDDVPAGANGGAGQQEGECKQQ